MAEKTFTVTKSELQSMINEQRKVQDYLANNNTDTKAMTAHWSSVATGILGLVFWQVKAASIALGVLSVLSGAGATNRSNAITAANEGERYLLRIKNTMENVGAATVNMTANYKTLSHEYNVRCIDNATTNYMKTAGGITIGS